MDTAGPVCATGLCDRNSSSFRCFGRDRFVDVNLVLLPGDGIGPEVVSEAERVLEVISESFGHQFQTRRWPMGGHAIDSHGDPLPDETLAACRTADAILLGAVGGPKWDDPGAKTRPEAGLVRVRKELG